MFYILIYLHDMPENGFPSDFDHRFGADGGLLANPGPHSSGQNDDLHRFSLCIASLFILLEAEFW